MSPYRSTPTISTPPKPWRCRLGWHALGAKEWRNTYGRDEPDYLGFCIRRCPHCDHVRVLKVDTATMLERRSRAINERSIAGRSLPMTEIVGFADRVDEALDGDPIIVERRDVSEPGSRIRCTEIVLSEAARRSLTFNVPPPPKNPGPPKEQPS